MTDECMHLLDPATCADCRSIPGYDDDHAEVTECRSCGDPIVWTTTGRGKRMPVDADPSRDGNVRLDDDPLRGTLSTVLGGHLLRDAQRGDVPLHTSHFATCMQAEGWRR